MRKLFLLVCLALLIVGSASAAMVPFYPEYSEEIVYTDVPFFSHNSALDNYAITNSYINIVPGTDLQLTLYFNDGSTKTGSVSYALENYGVTDTLTLTLDSD